MMVLGGGRAEHHSRVFTLTLIALVVLAWVVLGLWGASPYGRFLDHDEVGELVLRGDLWVGLLAVVGWVLMTVAMMLPTSLPLVNTFQRLVRRRSHPLRLVLLLLAGYLGVWTLFGVLVHLGDLALHEVVELSAWLEAHAGLLGAGTLAVAGLYQFTPLKYYCLDKCRSPLSFIAEHWRGKNEGRQALLLGIHHGLFCLGCCWSLMLLMFVVGVGNLGWMLILGAAMAVEKNVAWGRQLSIPLGVGLLCWGLLLALAAF